MRGERQLGCRVGVAGDHQQSHAGLGVASVLRGSIALVQQREKSGHALGVVGEKLHHALPPSDSPLTRRFLRLPLLFHAQSSVVNHRLPGSMAPSGVGE
jgi:hypothetical protein